MSSKVVASRSLRFAANAIPTCENSRSTAAEDAGQPKYCRTITAKFGNFFECASHQSMASRSVLYLI